MFDVRRLIFNVERRTLFDRFAAADGNQRWHRAWSWSHQVSDN